MMTQDDDFNAKGQHDGEKSRDRDGFIDIAIDQVLGGTYNPPSNPDDKAAYDAGYKIASSHSPKK